MTYFRVIVDTSFLLKPTSPINVQASSVCFGVEQTMEVKRGHPKTCGKMTSRTLWRAIFEGPCPRRDEVTN